EDGVLEGDGERGGIGMAMGRENVDRRDGGLGKARWERLMKSNGGRFISRALPGACEVQVEAEARLGGKPDLASIVSPEAEMDFKLEESRTVTVIHHHEDSRSNGDLFRTATDIHQHEDNRLNHTSIGESLPQTITTTESFSYNGDPGSPASPSPVYITITDLINGPSFKPSSTKPIPRWMRQLPNGREREQVHLPATTASAAAESEIGMLSLKDNKDILVPSSLPSVPEEQKPPSQMTHVAAPIPTIPEAIPACNDRRMTMSTPPKMHHQRPEYDAGTGTPLYTGGEMGVKYLKRYHLRALEERERWLQESKTGNIALERVGELGSVKQVVDRAKGMQIMEADAWRENEGEGERQEWKGKEMLRNELNGLFRRG
ncbi:hypothetical protein V498_01791, partial [Pseudogymnoascus sp. VKM F-4517 (FW-2822)]